MRCQKLPNLIREKAITKFIGDWKIFMDIFLRMEKMNLLFIGLMIRKGKI